MPFQVQEKASEGWTLISTIDDDGGKLLASMGGGQEATLSSSLSGGSFNSKEDRLVLIFARPAR